MNDKTVKNSSGDSVARRIIGLLPPRINGQLMQELDCYGIRRVIASTVGIPSDCPTNIRWGHGWQWDPITSIGQLAPLVLPSDRHLVATKGHAEYLEKNGFSDVHAVGMPILYVPDPKMTRVPGSLLVMPPHSLAWTEHNWDQGRYVQYIREVGRSMSSVVACISGSCVDHGYWCDAFESAGIPWIRGAEAADQNALLRMRMLFGVFEYMTTNVMGSHVAYASLSGCKVSIAGPYANYDSHSFQNDEYYRAHPDVLAAVIAHSSEAVVRSHYPELFCEPDQALERVSWAEKVLGKDRMRPPREIAALLGWPATRQELARYHVRRYVRRSALLTRIAGAGIRLWRKCAT